MHAPFPGAGLCQLQSRGNQTRTIPGEGGLAARALKCSLLHQVALSSQQGSGTGASLLVGGVMQEIKHLERARDQQRTDKKYSVHTWRRIQT